MAAQAPRAVQVADLDRRLVGLSGRTDRLQVLIDHDTSIAGRCPECGWATTPTRRDCPSRTVALCLLEARPLPSWLAHLTEQVPAVRARGQKPTDEQRRAEEDAADGLFPAPCRATRQRGTT